MLENTEDQLLDKISTSTKIGKHNVVKISQGNKLTADNIKKQTSSYGMCQGYFVLGWILYKTAPLMIAIGVAAINVKRNEKCTAQDAINIV